MSRQAKTYTPPVKLGMAQLKGSLARARGLSQGWRDGWLLFAVGSLICLGLVMIASATLYRGINNGTLFHYEDRQLLALALGAMAAFLVYLTPTSIWEKNSTWLYFAGLILLLLVFVPGLGHGANGAVRWVKLGPFTLQTSEFMKLFLILYLAGYLVRRQSEVASRLSGFLKPLVLLLLACSVLMLQPDFGTTVVLLATTFALLFLAGAPLWQFAVLVAAAIVVLSGLVVINPERIARVTTFLNPWADPRGNGYQLINALIAFGRGEWTGVGLGNGIQKQYYLPEAHTDFIMAVIGEEFGLAGTVVVIALFGIVIWRAFAIGLRAEQRGARYAAYVAYGLGMWLGMQAFINIGVNTGALPTKGLTLPFVSYGSNSLIVCCIGVGMLLRVHRENHEAGPPPKEGKWQRA